MTAGWRALTVSCIIGMVLWSPLLAWSDISPSRPGRLKVAATIFPLYDLVRNIAGSAAEVVLIVPPGVSPHTFEVKPSHVRVLIGSAALFVIGHGLDDWVVRLAREAGVAQTIVAGAKVSLRRNTQEQHGHGRDRDHTHLRGAVDPHYWLSIPNALLMIQHIAEALGRLDPASQSQYQSRAVAYGAELRRVDTELRQLFADLPRRDIATFHMAFEYFAAEYGLNVVAVFEPVPGKEPAPRYVEAFQRQVRSHNLRVLFLEPQLPEAPLRGLTRDLGVTLRRLDPLGGGTGVESYLAMMRFNANQMATALRE